MRIISTLVLFFLFTSSISAETFFLIIRHGETDWNRNRIYQGQSNIPLNEKGHQQAEMLALNLIKNHNDIGSIYSSDLERTSQTAAPTAIRLGLEIKKSAKLREIHFGIIEGAPVPEVEQRYGNLEARYPKLHLEPKWWTDPHFPGAESYESVYLRASQELIKIANIEGDKKIAVFCHGGVIKALYLKAVDTEIPPSITNCSVFIFKYSPETPDHPFIFLGREPLQASTK